MNRKRLVLTNSIGGPKLVNFVDPLSKEDVILNEGTHGDKVFATRKDGTVLATFDKTSLNEVAAEIVLIVKDWMTTGDERLQELSQVSLG